MKSFEQVKKPVNAATVIGQLFNDYKLVDEGVIASKYLSPSGLACQVQCAWKLQGIPQEGHKESFQSCGFADAGEDRHKRIQEFLSKTEYWVDIREYIRKKKLDLQVIRQDGFETLLYSPKYQCRFKCDGMLLIDGIYYVLEIKTEGQNANRYRTGPEPKHQKQGITYTLIMHTDRILWIYEGRDFLEQKPFVQEITKEEKEQMDKYLLTIVENKSMPEKLMKDETQCGYCPYKKTCKAYFKMLADALKGIGVK